MKKTNKTVVTLIPAKPVATASLLNMTNNTLEARGFTTFAEIDECALFISTCYSEIFDIIKKKSKKQLSIVKITANNRSIYRRISSVAANGFIGTMIGLSSNSQRLLSDKEGQYPSSVIVSKGNRVCFYFHHPHYAVRIAVILGSLSVLLSLLSLIVSFL